mmetsp:Transcript_19085/g.50210  ORF Transcript_19085/g.50210 Transcript_19085/m.50210 type:complete len:331 (-) Transcript_19085:152-1144(-)|eukprot:CAMPEP_0119479820 /NCGR_PEP_ID=MMETSP1344-20130328/8914_1 /TAXON_ID=236787 /ORGANISM="Florenciella parvula, Strain CCMP2471" /LENGTH=330 /DNA_ID=CAMNT_0007514085 /DNA_START=166 /DNA_END=1161 /DNA_ORIENTATION=+
MASSPAAAPTAAETKASLLATMQKEAALTQMVDLEAVKRFVFPQNLQHPMSTGRLFAFGFYGPLDADARLRSGHKGQHVVGNWELDTMCRQFEREDILQIYMLPGQTHSNLSEDQAEEILAQADSRLKVAKGKAMMKQVTPEEVDMIFSDLEPDPATGLLQFHDCQQRIIEYRQYCIKLNKEVFPEVTSKAKRIGSLKSGPEFTPIGPLGATYNEFGPGRSTGRRTRGVRVGASVAPATMFLRDKGLNSMEVASSTNKLLCHKAFSLCNIADGNSSELTANVRLVRSEPKDSAYTPEGRSTWDRNHATRGQLMGAFVKAPKSSTTVKRKC